MSRPDRQTGGFSGISYPHETAANASPNAVGDGNDSVGEGHGRVGDGDSMTGEGNSRVGEGNSVTGEGNALAGDGNSPTGDGNGLSGEGNSSAVAIPDSVVEGRQRVGPLRHQPT